MSDLGSTTTPVEKPVANAEKVDEIKQNEGVAAKEEEGIEEGESMPTDSKGKGKGKAVVEEEEDDDDDEDDDEEEESDEEEDEDDIAMDEVDLNAIIPPNSRRSARAKQVDYSSEEALKKAGLASGNAAEGDATAAAETLPADEDEDEDFHADDTMEDD